MTCGAGPDLGRLGDSGAVPKVNFASDNTAGVAPAILDAIVEANRGFARGYGDDDWTASVERRLSRDFRARGRGVPGADRHGGERARLGAGFAAVGRRVLSRASPTSSPTNAARRNFSAAGSSSSACPAPAARLALDALQAALAGYGGHSPHQVIPSALSITQASEAGTIYRTGEIAALGDLAHARAMAVHMDGARFANALVRLNATPAQLTWRSGVDVLSLGATKGGALAAEAVVFFDPARAALFGERRKRAGHLLSKHRFIAAQFLAYLADDRWLELARRANAMADRLAQSLSEAGLQPVWPVEANLVFIVLPRALDAKLRAAGASYYVRNSDSLDVGPGNVLARLVTSFATEDDDIDRFVGLCNKS